MAFIDILGGVFLILFGLRFLRKGFARVFGGELIDWLRGYTRTRGRSFIGGAIAGTVMPSSTAMAFLSVQMSREGKIAWPNVFAVLIGAQVGITVLIQVLSFNLGGYAGWFLVFGGFLFLYLSANRARGVGQTLLSFGFLLLGMRMISGAARSLGGDPAVVELFAALANLPLLLIGGAVVLTVLLQSSTASIAVALGLAASGHVTQSMLFIWVLGTNIGLCMTVLVAGWSRPEGKRLGFATLLVKIPLVVVWGILILQIFDERIANLPLGLNQQAAWLHTLFNASAAFGIFFADNIQRLVGLLVPSRADDNERAGGRLDWLLLQNPPLALNAAVRETLRAFDALHILKNGIIQRLGQYGSVDRESLKERAARTIRLRNDVSKFLENILDDGLDADDRRLKDAIEDLMREMPVLVRTLERDMLEEAELLLAAKDARFAPAVKLIEEASQRLGSQLELVARMLMQEKPELARTILQSKQENSAWMIAAKRNNQDLPDPAWEILDDFQQLNRRLSGVAYLYSRDLSAHGVDHAERWEEE